MSMRETLREAARVISIVVEQIAQLERKDPETSGIALSAALRVLADRWDAEEARAVRMSENGQTNVLDVFAAKEVRTVLTRLGAPVTPGRHAGKTAAMPPTHTLASTAPVTPGEPGATCHRRCAGCEWACGLLLGHPGHCNCGRHPTPSPPRSPEAPQPAAWKDDQTVGQVLIGVAARSPEAKPPKCECDAHDKTSCTRSADYLVTRAGKRLAVCDRCTLTGDGIDDRDLNPDWSQHRPAGSPEAKACEAWCSRWAGDLPNEGVYWAANGQGFCSMRCHRAGKPLNPRPAK